MITALMLAAALSGPAAWPASNPAAAATADCGKVTSALRSILGRIRGSRELETPVALGTTPSGPESLMIRIPDWKFNPLFSARMYSKIEETGAAIRTGRKPTLNSVLDDLASERHRIAVEGKERDASNFGRPRDNPAKTQVQDSRYQPFLDDAVQRGRELATPQGSKSLGDLKVEIPDTGQEVLLTRITFAVGKTGEKFATWWHPETNIPEVMAYADRLYREAIQPGIKATARIRLVAELHWWLSHAMPYYRGSAAITDACTKSIFNAFGIPVGRWKPGISPDIEAFHRSREDFIKSYADFFE